MNRRTLSRAGFSLFLLAALLLGGWRLKRASAPSVDDSVDDSGPLAPSAQAAPEPEARAPVPPPPLDPAALAQAVLANGKLTLETPTGGRTLTLDPALQEKAKKLLSGHGVARGALVAIEPSSGRILALADVDAEAPSGDRPLYLSASFPSASIFKMVTGSALLDAGVSPEQQTCYHGGRHGLTEALLEENARRDFHCVTLAQALGHSANVVFGRLAQSRLNAAQLYHWIDLYGFNREIPFAMPVEVSKAEVAFDRLGFALTAAGFGETHLSPLHGALLAAAVGAGGEMPKPRLFEDEAPGVLTTIPSGVARALGKMMETTVEEGTARDAFRARGKPALGDVKAAGKTGTLATREPFRIETYTWFVGYAPAENPTIAVAALVVNGPSWRVKAPLLAREVMQAYLGGSASPYLTAR